MRDHLGNLSGVLELHSHVILELHSHVVEHLEVYNSGPVRGLVCWMVRGSCVGCRVYIVWRSVQVDASSSSSLLSSLELSGTKVCEPEIRALLRTASHFCEKVVLKSRMAPN